MVRSRIGRIVELNVAGIRRTSDERNRIVCIHFATFTDYRTIAENIAAQCS